MSLKWMRGAEAEMDSAIIRGGPYADDLEVVITRLYGPNSYYASGFHHGLDMVPWKRIHADGFEEWWPYPAGEGAPLLSLGHGVVYWRVNGDPSYGNAVGIEYDDSEGGKYQVQYFHLRDGAAVAVGESVTPGQIVGLTGTTGNSTGPHLHMAVYHNHYIEDPLVFLDHAPPLGTVPQEPYVVVEAPLEQRIELPSRIVYVGYDPQSWTHEYEVRIAARTQTGAYQETGQPYMDGAEEVWPFRLQDWG